MTVDAENYSEHFLGALTERVQNGASSIIHHSNYNISIRYIGLMHDLDLSYLNGLVHPKGTVGP